MKIFRASLLSVLTFFMTLNSCVTTSTSKNKDEPVEEAGEGLYAEEKESRSTSTTGIMLQGQSKDCQKARKSKNKKKIKEKCAVKKKP